MIAICEILTPLKFLALYGIIKCLVTVRSIVDSLLTNTPNNGPLPNNGHCRMYQLRSPYIQYST